VEDTADQDELRSENGQSRGANSKQEDGTSQKLDNSGDSEPRLPFKQLGDVLDQWYNKHREIADAHERNEKTETHPDSTDMEGVEFEHLPDAMAKVDAQAIGAASAEESVTLNKDNEIEDDGGASGTPQSNINLDDVQEDSHDRYSEGDHMQVHSNDILAETAKPTSFVGDERQVDDRHGASSSPAENSQSDDVEDMDERLMNAHISLDEGPNGVSFEDAQKLWAMHEESTRSLALILTEHLRLILQPTQATKMRGDFRTGKRLNIKRIIPYIASSYKRDKIWMRRSTPTKRTYQIMLAIDDSKSMAESQSYDLAFETLALIAKSMSMLEVGELSVVGFGENLKVAHDFSTPFTSEAGARTVQHFTFSQTKTNVKRLLVESIALFRAARLRATGSATDLWQLQLIISDGICDDHPSIRQLVREAHEERIMIVFIVVDFATQTSSGAASSKQSILDMPTAYFVQDEAGNTQLKMVKYLDTFPFKYYLIVQNIQELPNVLAGALRQWFAEVVDSKI
jgi:midasin